MQTKKYNKLTLSLIVTGITGYMLLISPATASVISCQNPPGTSCDVVNALGNLNTNISNTLAQNNTNLTNQITQTLGTIFSLTDPKSILNKSVDLYTKQFYNIYAPKSPDLNRLSITDPSVPTGSISFYSTNSDNNTQVSTLLANDIGYNLQDQKNKFLNKVALLTTPFGTQTGLSDSDLSGVITLTNKNDPYGSLGTNSPSASNAPNLIDLIGPDSYDNKQQNKAKMFIRYVQNATPSAPNFIIPPKSAKDNNNNVTVTLPYKDDKGNFKTKSVKVGDYDKMASYLNKNQLYQEYTVKVRTLNVLRSLYAEALFRMYQDRLPPQGKAGSTTKSLMEQEKDMIFAGLNQKYYDDLRKQSIADMNMETLYAINKMIYLLHKLNQNVEKMNLTIAISGMQLTAPGMNDDRNFVQPIGKLIENECWLDKNYGTAACSGVTNNSTNSTTTSAPKGMQ